MQTTNANVIVTVDVNPLDASPVKPESVVLPLSERWRRVRLNYLSRKDHKRWLDGPQAEPVFAHVGRRLVA